MTQVPKCAKTVRKNTKTMKTLAGSVGHTEVNTIKKMISGGVALRKEWTTKDASFKSTNA